MKKVIKKSVEKPVKSELLQLHNIGPAMLERLHALEIFHIADLIEQDADEMYARLCELEGKKQHPCIKDVFASIIHESRTGQKTAWQDWLAKRKAREQ